MDRYDISKKSSRKSDYGKTDQSLTNNLNKATIGEETAPKRKHVRSCIVYTWDHRSSLAFWTALKVLPILNEEIQTFKALICVHKVLQEGHPITLQEAQPQIGWLESCARVAIIDSPRGYGSLIRAYVLFLIAKIDFHRKHPEFNGTFEYEEYISLKNIDDPNEGYETITDLMDLQDQIDAFQKLIFANFRTGSSNECRISALVPLVQESYGVYKFLTSMLRAMHSTTDSNDALQPLRSRYNAQHYQLIRFYYECSNLRYLTNLISVPRLPQDPPDLQTSSDENPPALPQRPKHSDSVSSAPSTHGTTDAEPITDFWSTQQRELEDAQQQIQLQRDAELRRQEALAVQQQLEFEEQQRIQADRLRLAQEQLMRDQLQSQAQGRVAELERDILSVRGIYEQNCLLLEQYDKKVKSLENELQQQNATITQQSATSNDLIISLRDQLATWKNKYDALAKLYSQLRQEHIDLLSKVKQLQFKANSAQEAVAKEERAENQLKSKNVELANIIRDRDRLRSEFNKLTEVSSQEIEALQKKIQSSKNSLDLASKEKSVQNFQFAEQIADIQKSLDDKTHALDNVLHDNRLDRKNLEDMIHQKEEELDLYKTEMDSTLLQLKNLKMSQTHDVVITEQIDTIVQRHIEQLTSVIDALLQTSIQRIDDAIFELDSPMQASNKTSTPQFLLSNIEKASAISYDFAFSFNNFISDTSNSNLVDIINTANLFANAISSILIDAKSVSRSITDNSNLDSFLAATQYAAAAAKCFFQKLLSHNIAAIAQNQRSTYVSDANMDVQNAYQSLAKLAEQLGPTYILNTHGNDDIGELVDRELANAANTITAAIAKLETLLSKPKSISLPPLQIEVHDSILAAAIAITNAISNLIKAATETQQEIVAQGKGSSTTAAFYKRNNRWTEGLISAAKTVAASTNILIETADGVIADRHSPEQLIVASNEVAAATAQLVAASRVKAKFMSKTQDNLESASKAVTTAVKLLVKQVENLLRNKRQLDYDHVDYEHMLPHDFKVREMEQQVEILKLENQLQHARMRLGEMRKVSYQQELA